MSLYIQKNRTIIRLSGNDAEKLLNSCLSVEFKTGEKNPLWWALLSAQGKILAEGIGAYFDGSFYLDIDKSNKQAFLQKMKLYKMRSNVEIEDLENSHVLCWAKTKQEIGVNLKDPRDEALGFHVIVEKEQAGELGNETEFTLARIKTGIAQIAQDFAADKYFPHDLGMDLLNGVDFSKGCYIGQEIVSRMQYKGAKRKRILVVSNINGKKGDNLLVNEKAIGMIGEVKNGQAIAIVRLDKITQKDNSKINNQPVQLALPKWANYDFDK